MGLLQVDQGHVSIVICLSLAQVAPSHITWSPLRHPAGVQACSKLVICRNLPDFPSAPPLPLTWQFRSGCGCSWARVSRLVHLLAAGQMGTIATCHLLIKDCCTQVETGTRTTCDLCVSEAAMLWLQVRWGGKRQRGGPQARRQQPPSQAPPAGTLQRTTGDQAG